MIVGTYIDAAKTARKRMYKRTNFLRMLEDVKHGKVDLILFTRLDRWFRSVADYYKVMEILDAHNCGWLTTQEQYDTTTAGGRLYINLRLSIAQNEADLCGERIGVVFDNKVKHGTVVSGSCPFGYRVNSEKRLEVIPEQAAIVQDAFEHYRSTVSQYATIKYIRETYGVNWCTMTFQRMLYEKLYTGRYERRGRSNDDFCPAIISQELFDTVQKLTAGNVKATPAGRKYLFSSLLICAECSHRLSSFYNHYTIYYRCNHYSARGLCTHNKLIREDVIEKWLFDHLWEELEKYRLEWEVKEAQRKRTAASIDRAAIRRKLSRLKELYVTTLRNTGGTMNCTPPSLPSSLRPSWKSGQTLRRWRQFLTAAFVKSMTAWSERKSAPSGAPQSRRYTSTIVTRSCALFFYRVLYTNLTLPSGSFLQR